MPARASVYAYRCGAVGRIHRVGWPRPEVRIRRRCNPHTLIFLSLSNTGQPRGLGGTGKLQNEKITVSTVSTACAPGYRAGHQVGCL